MKSQWQSFTADQERRFSKWREAKTLISELFTYMYMHVLLFIYVVCVLFDSLGVSFLFLLSMCINSLASVHMHV